MVGLTKAETSYKVQVTSLSLSTGEVLASARIPSIIQNGLTDFLVLSDDSQNARIVWLQDKTIFSIPLSPTLNTQASTLKGTSYTSIKDIGLSRKGLFVAHKADGSAQVIGAQGAGFELQNKWDFIDSVSEQLSKNFDNRNNASRPNLMTTRSLSMWEAWTKANALTSVEFFGPIRSL